MSDIVERARDYARNCGGPPEEYLTWQLADEIVARRHAQLNQAAEIERLRAERDELVAVLHDIAVAIIKMQDDAQAVVNMLVLCGESGGMRPSERPAQYLRRLIDDLILAQRPAQKKAAPV